MAKLNTRKDDEGKPLVEIFTTGQETVTPDGVTLEGLDVAATDDVFTEDELAAAEALEEDDAEDDAIELDPRHRHREEKLVPVRPRRTVLHTRIGADWFNFVEGREIMVSPAVRDWLFEKKVI